MKTFSKKETNEAWKSYPIRLTIKDRFSKCCTQPLVLVESSKGGFVKANCSKCNQLETLSNREFETLPQIVRLIVCCPDCKETMVSKTIAKNYSYLCEKCGSYIWLSDLLPN